MFLIHGLLDPFVILWLLILAALLLRLLKKRRAASVCFFGFVTWLFLISVSPLPQWLVYNLESKYRPLDTRNLECPPPVHILVLGGGHYIAPELPPTGQLMSSALARLVEAIRIKRQVPQSVLVFSGGSNSNRTTHAEMLGMASLELGVSPDDTVMIMSSRNTYEESVNYSERFGEENALILVTNAIHMRRAMLYFEAAGLNPIPAPANQMIKIDPEHDLYNFKPSMAKIVMMKKSLHEYAGLIKFRFIDK